MERMKTLSFIKSTWSSLSKRVGLQISCLNNVKTLRDSYKRWSFGCSPSSSTVCSGAEFISTFRNFKKLYLVVAKCLYMYCICTIYILVYHCGGLFLYKNPSWTLIKKTKNRQWGHCIFLNRGLGKNVDLCLNWYLGGQLLLCICVFSVVSRRFCSTHTKKNPSGRNALALGVWCVCWFMWKMFYVLFMMMRSRSLINLSPKSRWQSFSGCFGWKLVLHYPFSCMLSACLRRISAAVLARNTAASIQLCRSLQSERLASDQDCIRGPASL